MKTIESKSSGNAAVDALGERKCKNIISGCTLERAQAAFRAYARWLRRQERAEHPQGKTDGHRWYPSEAENCDGFTRWTRSPSRSWPWSYMLAARSLSHCESLDDADHDDTLLMRRAGLFAGLGWGTSDADAKAQAEKVWTALHVRAGLPVGLAAAVVQRVAPAGAVAANDDVRPSQTA